MKRFYFFILTFWLTHAGATGFVACGSHEFLSWNALTGPTCASRFPSPSQSDLLCMPFPQSQPTVNNWLQNFPYPMYQRPGLPWWALQGNVYYPNVQYPGVWTYPGINSNHYPGQGEVFAAKPNVYVQSISRDKKFEFKFTSPNELNFLATTPILESNNSWEGRIINKDQFKVDDIVYDYLFYDIRLPKEKMQFEHGLCATREGAIEWMLKDLKEMGFSDIARQDFNEHWQVKIPDYPIYCIYPQYNEQLDIALPIKIEVEQVSFRRSLYVLIPHQEAPDMDVPQATPLPTKDPQVYRPESKVTNENMFMEWGVAFLGQ